MLKSEGIKPSLPFLRQKLRVEDPIKIYHITHLNWRLLLAFLRSVLKIWLRAGYLFLFLWVWGDMIWKWKMKRMEQCSAYWCDALTLFEGAASWNCWAVENSFSSSVQVKMVQMKCIPSPHQACPASKSASSPFYHRYPCLCLQAWHPHVYILSWLSRSPGPCCCCC